jgi:predicted transcriptional regulator
MTGWIKLHRSLLGWEWYGDINVKVTFLHLILSANHAPKKWRGIDIGRGQLWTSIGNLAKEIGLSEKQTRNSLKKLESTNEISIKGASNGTMITVCKYDSYQDIKEDKGERKGKQKANEGQTKGEQWATNKNDNNTNNEKEIKKYFEDEKLNTMFEDFIEHRKQMKKPMTDRSITMHVNKLNDESVPNAIKMIEKSIEHGWSSVYELKEKDKVADDTAGDLENGWRFVPMSEAYEIVRDLSFTSMHEAELRGEGDEYVRKVMNARVQYDVHGNAWKTRK